MLAFLFVAMVMCITVRVHYSPSRAIDVPWGDYLYLRHKGKQERRRAALGGLAKHMPAWKYKMTYRKEGGISLRQRWFIAHKWDILTVVIPVLMLLTTYYLISHPIAIPLANRYFVGNGVGVGDRWERTQNWSASSGGAGSAGIPDGTSAVIFDTNSGTCIVDADAACLSFAADGAFTGDFDTDGFDMTVTNAYTNASTGTTTQGSGILTVGTFSYTGSGSFDNLGRVMCDGSFTATGTWNDTGGDITITSTGTWNASITTTVLEWDAPGDTITVTGGNTIVVVDTLELSGNGANHLIITAASNFTIDIGASISIKEAVDCDIDHMQLGAGDTLTVFSGTDNGNNDADITFAAFDRTANATGAFDDNAKWNGGNAPATGVSWEIPAGIVMTIQGNEACGSGAVSGTLTFDGQTDSVVAQLTIDGGDEVIILDGGTLDTTGTGTTGYAKILSSDANDCFLDALGTLTLGTEFHFDTVDILHGEIANGEKVVLDGDCEWHDGFAIVSGGELDDGGNTLTVSNGNLTIASGGYTATGTLILAGTHSLDGAGLSFNILNVGTSPGTTTLEANLNAASLTIASGDELDANAFDVTITGITLINGLMTCSTGTMSLGSGAAGIFAVDIFGTLTGGSGSHTYGGDTVVRSGGTWTATSGNTTFNESHTNSTIDLLTGGTLVNSGGTFTFTFAGIQLLNISGTGGPNSVIINNAANDTRMFTDLSIATALTVTSGTFKTKHNVDRNLTVGGDVSVTGTLNEFAGTHSYGSISVESGGTWTATSGTGAITSETVGGYAILVDAAATYTHSSGEIDVATATATNIDFGGDSPYNFTYSGGSTATMVTNNTTVANNFSITDGDLDTGTTNWTVTGTTTIGDGVGAASSAQLVCNSSDLDLNGALVVDTDGEFSAPDASGTWTQDGAITNDGVITHNGGTCVMAVDAVSGFGVGSATVVLYNLTMSRTNGCSNDLTIENTFTLTGGGRLRLSNGVTVTMGTTTNSGNIINNGSGLFDLNLNNNTITIKAASPEFPCICTGIDWDWNNKAPATFNLLDLDYRIAAATGGGSGIVLNMTRCRFPLGLFITTGDTVKIAGGTASGFLKVEGDGTLQIVRGGGVFTLDGIGDPGPLNVVLPTVLNPPNIVPRHIEGVAS